MKGPRGAISANHYWLRREHVWNDRRLKNVQMMLLSKRKSTESGKTLLLSFHSDTNGMHNTFSLYIFTLIVYCLLSHAESSRSIQRTKRVLQPNLLVQLWRVLQTPNFLKSYEFHHTYGGLAGVGCRRVSAVPMLSSPDMADDSTSNVDLGDSYLLVRATRATDLGGYESLSPLIRGVSGSEASDVGPIPSGKGTNNVSTPRDPLYPWSD
eukprot:1212702-Pleurochrysis_carterae.AAC.2